MLSEGNKGTVLVRLSPSERRIFLGSISTIPPVPQQIAPSLRFICTSCYMVGVRKSNCQEMGFSIRTEGRGVAIGQANSNAYFAFLSSPSKVAAPPGHCVSLCQVSFSFPTLTLSEFILLFLVSNELIASLHRN